MHTTDTILHRGKYTSQQAALFSKQLRYTLEHSTYYQKLFAREGLDYRDMTIADLHKIPLTNKEAIQGNEEDFLCVHRNAITEYVTTSGTTGEPVTFMLSEKDLQRLARNEELSLRCADGKIDDVYQIMVTQDKRFMAGLAYALGARKLGAGVIRTGVASVEFQLDTILRMKPTAIIAVPSFVVKLIDYARDRGIDLNQTSVRKAILIGEPIRDIHFQWNALGQRIRDQWSIDLFSTYASTEMSTAFTECVAGQGGHLPEELIIAEVVDNEGNPVPEGVPGELVVTPLGLEAMPLLRFRTGDICRYFKAPCSCGRTSLRLGPVEGRLQQMIKLKGTSLYPPAIYNILNSMPEISQYLITLTSNEYSLDDVIVEYCCDSNDNKLNEKLRSQFKSHLRVVPKLVPVTADWIKKKTADPLSRKAITLIDERKSQH